MNSMATSGKNLQTAEHAASAQRGYEIRIVAPSAPNHEHLAHSISLAQRQRTPATRHYGGRSMRYRWMDDLKPWQVHMLYDADAVAWRLGLPLNTFLTACYGATFPGETAMASTFKRAMKRMGQWLRDNGVPVAFIYVHENPGDEKPNSHVLVHVPAQLIDAFVAKAGDWFDALDGGVKVDPRNDAQRRAKGLGTRLQYMSKGAPFLVCRDYEGHRARGGQGPIHFKRAGVAQLLSKEFSDTIKKGQVA